MDRRYNITIDHDTTPHSSDHSSASLTDGEDSSGTGVQVSPSSLGESQEYSEQPEETGGWLWYPDEINPSDSASRPRTSNHHRPVVEAPIPEQTRRHSSRRHATRDRIRHHPHHPHPPQPPQPPHPPHPRIHRPHHPNPPESVDSNEDWPPAYGRGPPLPHGRGYPHWAHVVGPASSPNYTPSYSSAQGYSAFPSTSVVPAGQLVPFASPSGGYTYAAYQAQGGGSSPGYFPPAQTAGPSLGNPVAAHGLPPYGGQEVIPHSSAAAYYPYNNQGYPMAPAIAQPIAPPPMFHAYPTLYSPPGIPSTPSPAPAPAPAPPPAPVENSKDEDRYEEKFDEKFARLEKILMDQKAEQEAKEAAAKKAAEDQAAKAAADKQRADEIAAAASAAAAAATEEAEKRAAEKAAVEAVKAAEEAAKAAVEAAKAVEEATKAAEETAKAREEAAKAAAEKAKATEEAAKAAEEMAKAKEEAAQNKAAADQAKAAADQAKAAADEAAAAAAAAAAMPPPPPPPPKEKKKPIKFKDAVGRKFSFPFHLCNTWVGMEELIRQAFLHVDVIGPHVAEGHYDLVGPNGEIILPQVWETMIEPDWVITMHMWPIPEPPPPPPAPPAKAEEPTPEPVVEVPPPPPPAPPPPTPPVEPDVIVVAPEAKKKKKPKPSAFTAWAYGSRTAKPKSLKALKKPEEAIQHDIVCHVM